MNKIKSKHQQGKIIKVFIADDHELVRQGIKSLIETVDDIMIVGEATNGKQAIEELVYKEADVVLMDIDMPIMNGYDTTKLLSEKYPDLKIIALTMSNEKAIIQKMLDAGAAGYVLKNLDKAQLVNAIYDIVQNKNHLGSEVSLTLMRETQEKISFNKKEVEKQTNIPLTTRELEILKLITQGFSNTEIGKKLFISHRTVDTHRTNIMQKLEVKNIAGLIKYAIQNGYID